MATCVLGSELVDNSGGRKREIRAAFRNFGGRENPRLPELIGGDVRWRRR